MNPIHEMKLSDIRKETDSLGEVDVPADKLWGAQTQRSLEHFSIGKDLIPREMITAYAILKKAAANANHAGNRLDDTHHRLIVKVCDEILAGQHEARPTDLVAFIRQHVYRPEYPSEAPGVTEAA